MNLRESLEKQLEISPETEFIGVVSASGVTGGSGALPADPWTLLLSFSGWKEIGGILEKTELTIRKYVPKSEITRFQKSIEPYDVLRVKVRLSRENAFGSPQALLLRSLGKDNSDAEMLAYAKDLQEPVTFRDSQFGIFTLDRRVNWYESTTKWHGSPIRLTIDASDSKDVKSALTAARSALTAARSLWASQKKWNDRIINYAVNELLSLKNQSWLDENEEEISAAKFASKMILESISVRADGTFQFWHNDGNLFGGHSIRVSGNLKDGPTDAGIEG